MHAGAADTVGAVAASLGAPNTDVGGAKRRVAKVFAALSAVSALMVLWVELSRSPRGLNRTSS